MVVVCKAGQRIGTFTLSIISALIQVDHFFIVPEFSYPVLINSQRRKMRDRICIVNKSERIFALELFVDEFSKVFISCSWLAVCTHSMKSSRSEVIQYVNTRQYRNSSSHIVTNHYYPCTPIEGNQLLQGFYYIIFEVKPGLVKVLIDKAAITGIGSESGICA